MIHALHGNFGLPSDWDAALPPGMPAKAWHLWEIRRNHPETRTLTGFASWFNQQIAAAPPDPQRVLAGYSLGGRLALHILLDRPDLWKRAVLLSTHPGLASPEERRMRMALDRGWQEDCLRSDWSQVLRKWNSQDVLQSDAPSSPAERTEPWREEIASGFTGWSLGAQHLPAAEMRRLSVPGCWLTGEQDHKFQALAHGDPEVLRGLVRISVPGARHRLLQEGPGFVREVLRA